jgi:DNA-binding response OmpR family regulator
MKKWAEILCVGRDPVLNRTRQLIFSERFEVEVAADVSSALALLEAQPFRMVLLCYSMSESDCLKIVRRVHNQSPSTGILALATGHQRLRLTSPDAEIPFAGPAELLAAAVAMISSPERPSETNDPDKRRVVLDESRQPTRKSPPGKWTPFTGCTATDPDS